MMNTTQTWRGIAYITEIAVKKGREEQFLSKVAEINQGVEVGKEYFSAKVLRDHCSGLTQCDVDTFLDWLNRENMAIIRASSAISRYLDSLKHARLAFYHVMHPDNKLIPAENSMLICTQNPRAHFHFSSQRPSRWQPS